MSIDPSVLPPGMTVNEPEPSEPSVAELRAWSAKWLGIKHTATWTRHLSWWDYQENGEHRSWDSWEPDENIGQAWLLLAKCHEWIISNHPDHVKCSVKIGGVMAKGIADTAPLAIVLAAYRAAQGKETP